MTQKNKNNVWDVATYETPTIMTLNIQSEGVLCGSGDYNLGGGGVYEDGDINDNGEY